MHAHLLADMPNKYTKKYDLDVKERKTLERKLKTERKYSARDKMIANQKQIIKKIEANSSNTSLSKN